MLLPEDVQRELGISRPTLYRMVKDGRLKPVEWNALLKRQQRHRFRRSDIDALKAQRGQRPGEGPAQQRGEG